MHIWEPASTDRPGQTAWVWRPFTLEWGSDGERTGWWLYGDGHFGTFTGDDLDAAKAWCEEFGRTPF